MLCTNEIFKESNNLNELIPFHAFKWSVQKIQGNKWKLHCHNMNYCEFIIIDKFSRLSVPSEMEYNPDQTLPLLRRGDWVTPCN